jgi:hypothetical protein
LLRDAAVAGELTAEQTREAARAAVDCMNEAGLTARYDETTTGGLTLPGYIAELGTSGNEALQAILDECDKQEYRWVSKVYQTQPTAVAVRDAHYEQFAPVARACLQGAGYEADPAADWTELESAMQAALQESGGEVNCFDDVVEAGMNPAD